MKKLDMAKIAKGTAELRELSYGKMRELIMKSLFKFEELSDTQKENIFLDIYHGNFEAVAKRCKADYLECAMNSLKATLEVEVVPSDREVMQVFSNEPVVVEESKFVASQESTDFLVETTRKGFLVLFKEWVIANGTLIANNFNDLSVNTRAVLNIARGDWSVSDYSISRLAQIHLKAMDELKELGGAN